MRTLLHFLWIGGIIIMIYAFSIYSGASMPYQDPTPELLNTQKVQIDHSKVIGLIGFIIFLSGLVSTAIVRKH